MDFSVISIFPVIWNYGPDIFSIGGLHVRWYNCIMAFIFILARQFLIINFKATGKEPEKVDVLTVYAMLGAILGARLFHVLFYDWGYFSQHLLEIFLPFRFSPRFEFLGYRGLASHGVIVGLIVSLALGVKKINKVGVKAQFLWITDRVVIISALCSCFVRVGNFMNSELYGNGTTLDTSVIFVRDAVNLIKATNGVVESVSVSSVDQVKIVEDNYLQPIVFDIVFKQGLDEESVKNFLENRVKAVLTSSLQGVAENIVESKLDSLNYVVKNNKGRHSALVYSNGLKRHASQLYEAFTYALIFLILYTIWYHKREKLRHGIASGLFLIFAFSLRFFHEMIKDGEVFISNTWGSLNTAQFLSIMIVLIGLGIFLWSLRRNGESLNS